MIGYAVSGRPADDLSERLIDAPPIDVALRRAWAEPLLKKLAAVVNVVRRHATGDLGGSPPVPVVREASKHVRGIRSGLTGTGADEGQAIFGIPLVGLGAVSGHVPVGVVGESGRCARLADLVGVGAKIPAGVRCMDHNLARSRRDGRRAAESVLAGHGRWLASNRNGGRLVYCTAEEQHTASLLAHETVHVVVGSGRDHVVNLLSLPVASQVVRVPVALQHGRQPEG